MMALARLMAALEVESARPTPTLTVKGLAKALPISRMTPARSKEALVTPKIRLSLRSPPLPPAPPLPPVPPKLVAATEPLPPLVPVVPPISVKLVCVGVYPFAPEAAVLPLPKRLLSVPPTVPTPPLPPVTELPRKLTLLIVAVAPSLMKIAPPKPAPPPLPSPPLVAKFCNVALLMVRAPLWTK